MEGVERPRSWRIHRLGGDRAGTWSISVTGIEGRAIKNLDLEDYR
jgi:toxin HigB-1